MGRTVTLPPARRLADGSAAAGWWHDSEHAQRILCDLCPRHCALAPGDRGFCFVRQNVDGEMVLTTYGRSTGFCVDPIEKKPLNHFLPGTAVLSFGTAGCNLGCKFCQNWDSTKSRAVDRASEPAEPETIAEAAAQLGCHSVAFTYNDPVIWAEYARDTALACRARGVRTVAVTAGYVTPAARGSFYEYMDAANVDLKSFHEPFYQRLAAAHLQPVLDTLVWLRRETDVWLEITNLIIPHENDSPDELRQLCDWILTELGDDVPLHFTAFHPDYRLRDRPPTPRETLLEAYDTARSLGIKYAYVGNVHDPRHDSTYCPQCGQLLIERNWHEIRAYHLQQDRCPRCSTRIAGRFLERVGDWGGRRLPVDVSRFASSVPRPGVAPASPQSLPTCPTTLRGGDAPGTAPATRPALTPHQEQAVWRRACEVIVAGVCGTAVPAADAIGAGAADLRIEGAFVTLQRGTHLRACCGVLGGDLPLGEALESAAHRTATGDVRLPPISPTELRFLHVDVSLLHNFQPITQPGAARAQAVQIGRHGLTIRQAQASGLLLPVVAVEQGWDAEAFLRHVCRKAGLPTTAWQEDTAQLRTFEALRIGGPLDARLCSDLPRHWPAWFLPEDLQRLAEHGRGNVLATLTGATPNYYASGCRDANVQAVAVSVTIPARHLETTTSRLVLRPGLPLQATLLECTQGLAGALQQLRLTPHELATMRADICALYDSALHGTVADAQLDGLDPRRRALVIVDQGRYAWTYDPACSPQELLAQTAQRLRVMNAEVASVLSLAVDTTARTSIVTSLPRPQAGPPVRPAAVADVFYPAEPAALRALVAQCLQGGPPVTPEAWPAVLVPHAGLRYSGRVAADVFRRVTIPERVIIFAPKHTRHGVPWSVAPCTAWAIPGHQVPADPEYARRLADALPGLELDASAHQEEHAIEVQLPILAQVAPTATVTGIVLGESDYDQCRRLAEGLAEFLRGDPHPPLLVISSDLHHYAPDAENRRLDRIAIDALRSLDPHAAYRTVRQHEITMCGLLPAVVVLESLLRLGRLNTSCEVAYATSADAGGSRDRVVGYVGLLFG
ncbi:MAG: AmmeMemoRadiSam system radical SAM enzyme [Pirellulaceae bacterium]|nr:AmmeMemoRadiSam system radical SAM enzyme [Pirellulaceae bacterium]